MAPTISTGISSAVKSAYLFRTRRVSSARPSAPIRPAMDVVAVLAAAPVDVVVMSHTCRFRLSDVEEGLFEGGGAGVEPFEPYVRLPCPQEEFAERVLELVRADLDAPARLGGPQRERQLPG